MMVATVHLENRLQIMPNIVVILHLSSWNYRETVYFFLVTSTNLNFIKHLMRALVTVLQIMYLNRLSELFRQSMRFQIMIQRHFSQLSRILTMKHARKLFILKLVLFPWRKLPVNKSSFQVVIGNMLLDNFPIHIGKFAYWTLIR